MPLNNAIGLPVGRAGSKRRWAIELCPRPRAEGLASPIGYSERQMAVCGGREADSSLINKRSWDVALGPIKQLPMNLLIMWMAGNSVSIFPIMMVLMLFMRPIQAVFTMQSTFSQIDGAQAIMQRIVFLIGNLAVLALAVYKCHTMGLLPTYESDWLSFVETPRGLEFSSGGQLMM